MKEKDIEEFRSLLLTLRKRLVENVNHMQDEAIHDMANNGQELSDIPFEHLADRATDNFAQEMMLNILQNSEAEVIDIDNALEKIDNGMYGICENCEGQIPRERLKALPFARLCIECKKEEEKAERV